MLIVASRRIRSALGAAERQPTPAEKELLPVMRRSLVLGRPVEAGALLQAEDLVIVRPGTGLAPQDLERVVGKKVKHPLESGAVLRWEDLEV